MQITKEKRLADKEILLKEAQQMQVNLYAIQGAIRQIELDMEYLDKTEEKKPKK